MTMPICTPKRPESPAPDWEATRRRHSRSCARLRGHEHDDLDRPSRQRARCSFVLNFMRVKNTHRTVFLPGKPLFK